MANYYELLGIKPNANNAEIQQAAKTRIDTLKQQLQAGSEDDAAIRREAAEIKEAFQILKNPAKRRAYNSQLGDSPFSPEPDSGESPFSPPPSQSAASPFPSPATQENYNPYQPPSAELQEEPDSVVGGNLEDAIQGNYQFGIMEVLREAWERTYGLKGAVWMATLAVWGISIVGTLLGEGIVMVMGGGEAGMVLSQILQFAVSILTYPITAGIAMLGIYRAVDREVMGSMAFGYFSFMVPLLFSAILIGAIMVALGFVAIYFMESTVYFSLILLLPIIYLLIGYFYVFPLIIEKRLSVWQAMETSRKAVSTHWLQLFVVYFLMSILMMLSVLPLFIGLIWTIPMFIVLNGILYRIIFGVGR